MAVDRIQVLGLGLRALRYDPTSRVPDLALKVSDFAKVSTGQDGRIAGFKPANRKLKIVFDLQV